MATPIRVGFIGLGKKTTWKTPGAWGSVAHLPYLASSSKYQITAVANSSIASAIAAIAFHNLGSDVKAYGTPEDIANDPNVDLIVVSVQVPKHYILTKPALLAGKDVFVEWPLGASLAEAEELTGLAKEKGVRTFVGLQSRANPLIVKVKELLQGGKIGKVTSSTVTSAFGLPLDMWIEDAEYYLNKDSGGNSLMITFGHFMDSFVHVLGDFASLNTILKTAYPTVNLLNKNHEVVNSNYTKTAPDQVSVTGTLTSGAVASLMFRSSVGPTIDGVRTRWLITGTDGELEITTSETQWQMTSSKAGTVLKARIGKGSEVEVVDYTVPGEVEAVLKRDGDVRNIASLYEAFADGKTGEFADFEGATETHRILERVKEAGK